MKNHHAEIETHAFYQRPEIDEVVLLPAGCSGGSGHNVAARSIPKNLIAQGIVKPENLRKFPIKIKKKKKSSEEIKLRNYAYFLSNVPDVDVPNPFGIDRLRLPELPTPQDLDAEVKRLSEEQKSMGAERDYIDMLLDVYKGGYYSAAVWNIFQRKDKTKQLKKIIPLQLQTDSKNYTHAREYFTKELEQALRFNKPYTDLISTQAMALPALCDAVRKYNADHIGKAPKIMIHQYMTDLPTEGAVHFFKTLANLTDEQCQQMFLYGVNLKDNLPVIDQHYGLSQKSFAKLINIDPADNPMVRPGFKDLKDISFTKKTVLKVQVKKNNTENTEDEYIIPAGEKIACIMLGGQASDDTADYAIKLCQQRLYKKIFVFGGDNKELKAKTQERMKPIFKRDKQHDVIFLGTQDDIHSARIRARANLKIIRGGGITIMEEMAIIHALLESLRKGVKTQEELDNILAELEQIILLHSKRDNKNIFTSGISWEDANGDELIAYLKKICAAIKISRTSSFEIIDELKYRSPFRKFLDARSIPETKPELESYGDIDLTELHDEINKMHNLVGASQFVEKLDALCFALRADYLDQKTRGVSVDKIESSPSIKIAKETTNLLKDLQVISKQKIDRIRKEDAIMRISKYEQKCHRISSFNPFVKAVAVVIAAAIGFMLGAVIGGGIGFFLGAWAGPGAVVTTLLGLLKGAYSGAALGLAVGTFLTGVSTASLSGFLLFKPNKMTSDVKDIAQAGKEMDFKLGLAH